ncbi:MAG TPA: alpha/beta fold hydrolase [Anaerolineae bacterium]|jgi:pimeloyl-[acyl-carrier protein] methyl ester esterase|nr:alpha/beta fold hydrolase [Anaerolineae bacterium]
MKAKEIIFIHGWLGDSTVWRGTISATSRIGNIHLIDLPPMINMSTYRDAVLRLIEEERMNKAYLIGWSLGALVALQVVQSAPEKVGGLVLVGGTGKFINSDTYSLGQPTHAVASMKQRFAQDPERTREEFFKQMFSREEIAAGLDRKVASEIFAGMRGWDVREAIAGLDYLLECDMLASLSLISQPTLLVHGNRDRICPLKGAEYLCERISDSQLLIIQNAGHIPFLTNPSSFNTHLGEWLVSH